MSIDPTFSPVSVAIAAWPQPPTFADLGRPLSLTISSWKRHPLDVLPTDAKVTGGYVTAALARQEAVALGFDEALLLNNDGHVAEAAIENLFVSLDGRLVTPPTSDGALPGITRASLLDLAQAEGVDVAERSVTLEDLYAADEVFCASTAAEVAAVKSIDRCEYSAPGELTRLLARRYADVTRGRDPAFFGWLDLVSPA
jgi:branched-chain amino acid aminotransferase